MLVVICLAQRTRKATSEAQHQQEEQQVEEEQQQQKTILCECQTEQTMWVISFLILSQPPSLPLRLSSCMLLLLLCRIKKFDEFFKRYFFNYQINAAEYFSKCVAQAKNSKTQNDTPSLTNDGTNQK